MQATCKNIDLMMTSSESSNRVDAEMMLRSTRQVVFAATMACGLCGLLTTADAQGTPCTCSDRVHGRVVEYFEEADEAFGLFEASVSLRDAQGKTWHVMTGLRGEFSFEGACARDAKITVELKGYTPVEVAASCGKPLEIVMPLAENGTTEPWQTVTTRTAVELKDSRTRVSLDEDELDAGRGVPLAKMMEDLPGVRALETGNVSKPMVQGMHSNRVVILFDGLRHESLSWGLDHAPEIDPFTAERISVVKGAAGVRYGPDAIGGVILVEPHPLPHKDLSLHGDVYAVGLSNGRQGVAAATLYGGLPGIDGFGWRVQGSGKIAGALETPTYVLDNTGARELNVSVAMGMKRPTWGFEVSASRFDAKNGVFTGVVSSNLSQFEDAISRDAPRGVERYRFDYDLERPRQEVVHSIARAHGHLDVGERGRLEATLAYQLNERSEFDLARGYVTGPQLDFTLSTGTLEVAWLGELSTRWSWSTGALGTLQTNVYRGRRFIPNYGSMAGGAFAWVKRKGERFDFELGARADVEQMTTFQREAIGGTSAPIESVDLSFLTPSLVAGGRWRVIEQVDASLNLSTASRAPTIDELFVDGVSQGVASFLEGDRELDPEQTWAATGNLEVSTSWFEMRVSPYAQYINGYIYAAPELDADGQVRAKLTINGGFPSFVYQQTDALFLGVDAGLRAELDSWLELETTASMVRARDLTRDAFLVFIPPDFISQTLRLKAPELGPFMNASLEGKAAYTAEQARIDLDSDFSTPPPAYLLIHAQTSADILLGEQTLRASVEVKNLTNQRYRSYLSRLRYFADEPGRSINVRLKYSF